MRRFGLLVTGVLLTVAQPVFAQDTSRGEFSAGWRYYHASINSVVPQVRFNVNDFPEGWYGDVAANLSPIFAIVGEAGGTYYSDEKSTSSTFSSTRESSSMTLHAFMGGVRVRAPQNPRFIPFGQVLFGGERNTSTREWATTFSGRTSTSRSEDASSGAALALDAGVTARAFIGVRASVGYVRYFGEADSDAFRLSLGAAFRF
jgi:hypothetical protein